MRLWFGCGTTGLVAAGPVLASRCVGRWSCAMCRTAPTQNRDSDERELVVKFALPDQLPKSVAELDVVRNRAGLEIGVFTARQAAGQEFTEQDVDRLEYLLDSCDKIDAVVRTRVAHHEAGHAALAVLMGGQVATAEVFPKPVTRGDGRTGRGECQALMDVVVEQQQHVIPAAGPVAEAV